MIFETENGKIEHRKPNVSETLRLIKITAMFAGKADDLTANIELLEKMLDEVKVFILKVEFENIKTIEELLNSPDYVLDVIAFVTEFLQNLSLTQKKKKR